MLVEVRYIKQLEECDLGEAQVVLQAQEKLMEKLESEVYDRATHALHIQLVRNHIRRLNHE